MSPDSVRGRHRRIRLDPKRRGYLLDGALQKGFVDRPDLSERQRLLVARWADRFTPRSLSTAQRELLAAAPEPDISAKQREFAENQRELRSPYLAIVFDSLSEEEQRLTQDPLGAGASSTGYPLTVGQLAALTGASQRQVRTWADEELLPFHRAGRDRRFYSAAVIRAFALKRAPLYSKTIAAAATRGEVGQHFQLLALTLAHVAMKMPVDVRERLIALVEDLSSSSRLMADVGDASGLQALWRGVDVHAAPGAESATPLIDQGDAETASRPVPAGRTGVSASGGEAEGIVIPSKAPHKAVIIEYRPTAGPKNALPLEITEADEILCTRYGGTHLSFRGVVVLTAPSGEGDWVNRMSGHKNVMSVHGTKAEAEEKGRELAREQHGKHVIYKREGVISRRRSYS